MSQANDLYDQAMRNNRNSFQQLKLLADTSPNNIEALNLLADCYFHGYGVSRKTDKAREKWTAAAHLGSDVAMCNLGDMYQSGQGVKANLALAAHWYLESAIRNTQNRNGSSKAFDQLLRLSRASAPNPAVLNNLGICLENGYSTPQSFEKAVFYYDQAARLGDDIAMCNLGMAFQYGRGVPVDLLTAEYWLQQSVKMNTTNPTGSQRAAIQLDELAIPLANYLFESVSENGVKGGLIPDVLLKLDTQHLRILQKDINILHARRNEMRRAYQNNPDIEKMGTLITLLQTIVNYPCCINDLVKDKHNIAEMGLPEARHLRIYVERVTYITDYTNSLLDILKKMRTDIEQNKWQVMTLFGNWAEGRASGIRQIKSLLDAMNCHSTHEIFNTAIRITDILAKKVASPSNRRHSGTTQFYSESLTTLSSLRFNRSIANGAQQQSAPIPIRIDSNKLFAFSPSTRPVPANSAVVVARVQP